MPSKRRDDVQRRLHARALGARSAAQSNSRIFRAVPPRLCVPVERVVDAPRRMLECVLLGFLSSGDHVVSYRETERGGCELEIWSFQPNARAELIATTPLFDCDGFGELHRGNGGGMRDSGALEGVMGPRDPGGGIRVHVCESWDGSTLIAHGEIRSGSSEEFPGRRPAKRCAVTVLPNPASVRRGTSIAATHMSYVSAAHSPFHPSWSGLAPAATPRERALDIRYSEGGPEREDIDDPYAFHDESETSPRRKSRKSDVVRHLVDSGKFTLNTADMLLTVDVATATLNPRDPHDRSLMEAQLPSNMGVSVTPACHSPLVTWHGVYVSDHLSIDNEDVYVEDQGALGDTAQYVYVSALPSSVRVCIITPWIALEMEKVLKSSLRAALDFGFSVRDYELLPLQNCLAETSGEEPSMLVAMLSVLAPSSWNHQPMCPGRMRVVVTLIERRLDRTPGGGQIVYSHKLPVHAEGKQPTPALLNAARAHIMQVRKSIMIPTPRWTRNASTMTNTNVVTHGTSASTIKHPTLPIAIVGYGISATRE